MDEYMNVWGSAIATRINVIHQHLFFCQHPALITVHIALVSREPDFTPYPDQPDSSHIEISAKNKRRYSPSELCHSEAFTKATQCEFPTRERLYSHN